MPFVTVVPVNGARQERIIEEPSKDFVTVLSIGSAHDADDADRSICLSIRSVTQPEKESGFVEEVTIVERRVGQKLGFGLKFDGGGASGAQCVRRLFIQCCAAASPADEVRCSWGALVEADEIVAICQQLVSKMTRVQIIHQLTEGPLLLQLKVRHFWLPEYRAAIIRNLLAGTFFLPF